MINFIIHEDDINIRNNYEMIIYNFIGLREEKFKIFDCNNYKKTYHNRSIFILSSDNYEDMLKLAECIRKKDDWLSQIIIISSFEDIDKNELMNNLLILSYIDKKDNVKEELKESLASAYKILTKGKTLNYLLNGEINKISYNSILYIEKSNNQNYCTIHTRDNIFIIKDTINHLEEQLDPAYFMKTHRSCIVNLYNINHYNCTNNTIYFDKKGKNKIDLVSRERRSILKSKLIKKKILKEKEHH